MIGPTARARWFALLVAGLSVAGCTASTSSTIAPPPPTAAPLSTAAPVTAPAPSRTTAIPAATVSAAPADAHVGALAGTVLAGIPAKGRAPKTGYTRAQFGSAWSDDNDDPLGHNGCDTRNDILRRDLTAVVLKPGTSGCTVLTGTLLDPYTGSRIAFRRGVTTSTAVQIDHVVALSDAWQTGAQYWSAQRRTDFANDPLELLAVDGPANEAKGDGDAATWLPPNKGYRCAYVARQVAVKARYGLWMTSAEKAAVAHVLASCPGQRVPIESGAPPAVATTAVTAPVHHPSSHPVSSTAAVVAGGGATAKCRDGTLSYAAHHQGACSHHGGVAIFYK